jgi:hypothetical protein
MLAVVVISILVILLAVITFSAIYLIKPRHFRASGHLTKWFAFSLELEDPEPGKRRSAKHSRREPPRLPEKP